MSNKTLTTLFLVTGLILSYYLTGIFLNDNFEAHGAAYAEGEGNILQEDFFKGILFIAARHFFTAMFAFSFLFMLVGSATRKKLFRIFDLVAFAVITTIICYTFFKEIDIFKNTHPEQYNRLIEIDLIWILRSAALYAGYWLANKLDNVLNKEKQPAKKRHQNADRLLVE